MFRYLLSLQIRRDLATGEFVCNENTAALLVSFIVQAECGDFSSADYPDSSYLRYSEYLFFLLIILEHLCDYQKN